MKKGLVDHFQSLLQKNVDGVKQFIEENFRCIYAEIEASLSIGSNFI